jgi:hypothetical protein
MQGTPTDKISLTFNGRTLDHMRASLAAYAFSSSCVNDALRFRSEGEGPRREWCIEMDMHVTLRPRNGPARCRRCQEDRQYAEQSWGDIRASFISTSLSDKSWKFDSSEEGKEGSPDYRVTSEEKQGMGGTYFLYTIEFD